MEQDNNQAFFEENFNDAETKEFFDKQGNVEVDDDISIDEKSDPVVDNNEDKIEASDEKDADQLADQKTNSEQDRYKAMAAEERNRRREIQKQIDTLAQENANLKGAFDKIVQKAREQAELDERTHAPNYEDDPLGALRYENENLKKRLHNVEDTFTKREQYEQQNYQMAQKQREFVNTYRQKAEEFKQSTNDFDDAYQYLLESREKEHRIAGYSEDQIAQLLYEDEAAVVATALQQGVNPASRIYELAKLRGYTRGTQTNTGTPNKGIQDKINANNEKIATLERGIKASRSVNNGGVNAKDQLTLEDVAEMTEDELDQVDWSRLMKLG